jgi:predicted GTPase
MEEKKQSELFIEGEPQSKIEGDPQSRCSKSLNVLLLGTSGAGKSSIINYLGANPKAPTEDGGDSCSSDLIAYEVTLLD